MFSIAQAAEWNPPPPSGDEFDWVQLSSGEWLKGELKGYIDNEVYFDSSALGLQKFSLGDIKLLKTATPVRVGYLPEDGDRPTASLLRDRIQVAEVPVEIREGEVRQKASGELLATRERLVTIASGTESEWDNWLTKLSFGLNLRQGNVSQIDYNAALAVTRSTPVSRLAFNYLGNYGESEGVEFANNHRADFEIDWFRSPRFFVRPAIGEYFRDPFQNIAHRGLLGSGVGYKLRSTPETTWRVSAGPSYQFTEFVAVPAGAEQRVGSLAAVVSSRYETQLNANVDFVSLYRGVVTSEEAGLYSHHFANSLSFGLTDDLDLDVTMIWDRIERPARGANGGTPKQDDLRFMLMLGMEL
jgi:hypothetical protein